MDKITSEIIRNGLYAIAREMKIAIMKTAGSPVIHSGGDASAAIFDADMQLVAQGNDIPTMLGSAVISTRASVEYVGRQNLRPGDVIVSNDAYLGGGNHQPDVQLTRPVFLDGEIIAFTMTRGHWIDIGGAIPGSVTTVTWDIFGEGLRIPPVLLFRDDKPVTDVVDMILKNTRVPEARQLDIQAQYAGTYVGERRLLEFARRYGREALHEAMAESLDYSERMVRKHIAAMPDGVYEAEDLLEVVKGAGWPEDPVPIRVKVTIAGDHITFDYTGSSPQVRGGVNCPYSVICNSTWYTVKAMTSPSIPINQGCYRPIEIIAPEGTVINCSYPASVVSGNTESSQRVIDLLLKALSAAVPQRVVAQSYASALPMMFCGFDPDKERCRSLRRDYIAYTDVNPGGLGARPDKDGVNGVRVHIGNTGGMSVEHTERYQPLLVKYWTMVTDSGGAGRFRGGCAGRRAYLSLFSEATFTIMGERGEITPKGLFGGKPGTLLTCRIDRTDGAVDFVPAKGPYAVVYAGDCVTLQPAGSGGYGDPYSRPIENVLADVRDEYVSREMAEELYGVVLDREGNVDRASTDLKRAAKPAEVVGVGSQ
ncbi:MAG: hydantoinase B/oxoprolinase family protein [Capsulimonadaceae bacterium]